MSFDASCPECSGRADTTFVRKKKSPARKIQSSTIFGSVCHWHKQMSHTNDDVKQKEQAKKAPRGQKSKPHRKAYVKIPAHV